MPQSRFRNRTKDVLFDPILASVSVQKAQPCQLDTLNLLIEDGPATQDFDDRDEIAWEYAIDDVNFVDLFAGDLSQFRQTHFAKVTPRVWSLTAQDYTARLDWTVIENGNRRITETVTARVNWIMGHAPTHDLTTGGVATISATVEPFDYTGMTKREALDQVARQVLALFYCAAKELQFFLQDDPPANPAPFNLGYPANPPTVHTYHGFDLATEPLTQVDEIVALGDGTRVKRTRAGAPDPAERRQRVLSLPSVKTLDALIGAADRELALYGEAERSGRLITFQPGLNAAQTVNIENSEWAIDEPWVITSVHIKPLTGNETPEPGLAQFTVGFAKRFACRRSPEDRLNDIAREGSGDRDDADDTCQKKLIWLDSQTSRLTVHWGRLRNIFTFDGDILQKWRPNLTRIFRREVSEFVNVIWDHVPEGGNEDERPVLLGAFGGAGMVGYHSNTGNLRWDISGQADRVRGVVAQDRPRFWLLGLFDDFTEARLQVRRGDTGALLSEVVLPDDYIRARGTPNGQHVAVAFRDASGSPVVWRIRFYDRELTLVEMIEVEEVASAVAASRFNDVDWAPDDDFNLYVLQDAQPRHVSKYNRDGELLWTTPLHTDLGYSYSNLASAGVQNVMLMDNAVLRIAGHIRRAGTGTAVPGWGGASAPSDAVMVTVSRASGAILHVSRFGGTTGDDDVQACSIIRATRDGCLYLGGAVNGQSNVGSVEGHEAPGTGIQHWLMRLPPVAGE